MKGSNPRFTAIGNGLDLTSARWVEVVWEPSSRCLWINTQDGCVGRIYNVRDFRFCRGSSSAEGGPMPVHVKRAGDALLIVWERDGEEPVTRRADGPQQACLFAVRLLIDCRGLRAGDRLTVREESADE